MIADLKKAYLAVSKYLDEHGIDIIRYVLAFIFIYFGYSKILGISPAEELVEKTVFFFPSRIFVPFLGAWEVAIGVGLLVRRFIPYVLFILLPHMAGTFLPLVFFPKVCFNIFPVAPSMEGQYILKNLVIIAAALAVVGKYNMQIYKPQKSS